MSPALLAGVARPVDRAADYLLASQVASAPLWHQTLAVLLKWEMNDADILWPRTAGDGPEGRRRVLASSQGGLRPLQQRAEETLGRERLPGEQRLGVEYSGDGTGD